MQVIKKALYRENERTKNLPEDETTRFRVDNGLLCFGEGIPRPCLAFEDISIHTSVLNVVRELVGPDQTAPLPVQAQVWPTTLSGRDIVVVDPDCTPESSSLLLGLPAMLHASVQPRLKRGEGPILLVLVGSAEAASSIHQICTKFGNAYRIKSSCVVGGIPKANQIRDLEKGVECVVATPARFLELVQAKNTTLDRVSFLALWSPEVMDQEGYSGQVLDMLKMIRPDRQIAVYASAPSNLLTTLLQMAAPRDPFIHIELTARKFRQKQSFVLVRGMEEKREALVEYYLKPAVAAGLKTAVYTRSKDVADDLTRFLRLQSFPALVLQEQKEEREWVVRRFASSEAKIIVCTDAIARSTWGHMPGFHQMIHFEMPETAEDYCQRLRNLALFVVVESTALINMDPGSEDLALSGELITHFQDQRMAIPPDLFVMRDAYIHQQARSGSRYGGSTSQRYGGSGRRGTARSISRERREGGWEQGRDGRERGDGRNDGRDGREGHSRGDSYGGGSRPARDSERDRAGYRPY